MHGLMPKAVRQKVQEEFHNDIHTRTRTHTYIHARLLYALQRRYRLMSEAARQKVREEFRIIVDGHNVPPPITNFRDMKIPPCVM